MTDFDYNINNYSIRELKEILELPVGTSLTYPIIHAAAASRLSTAANNQPLFRFFTQIKDKLTRNMDNDDDDESEYDDQNTQEESDDEDEDEDEDATTKALMKLQRPDKPVIHAQINDGVPFGNMNPFDRTTVSKVVCIDSVFRDSPNTTPAESFRINLPDNLERVISLSLTSINLPNTWFNISDDSTLNTFYIKTFNVHGMSSDIMHTITIPPGNYNATQMASTLNNIFSNTNGLRLIWVEINPVTLKTIFRAKTSANPGPTYYPFDNNSTQTSPDFYYEVHFQSVVTETDLTDCDTSATAGTELILDHRNIGYILGFRKTDYVVIKNQGVEDIHSFLGNSITNHCILESEGIFDSNIIDYVFLELDDFNNNFITNTVVSRTQRGYIGNNILAQIPVYSSPQMQQVGLIPPGNQITFKTRHYFGPVKIEKIAVRLLDKQGNLINLRGNNFSFTIDVVQQYS